MLCSTGIAKYPLKNLFNEIFQNSKMILDKRVAQLFLVSKIQVSNCIKQIIPKNLSYKTKHLSNLKLFSIIKNITVFLAENKW